MTTNIYCDRCGAKFNASDKETIAYRKYGFTDLGGIGLIKHKAIICPKCHDDFLAFIDFDSNIQEKRKPKKKEDD